MGRTGTLLRAGAPAFVLIVLLVSALPPAAEGTPARIPIGGAVAGSSVPSPRGLTKLPSPVRLPTYDLPPHRGAAPPASRFAVDPTAYYSAEPAPMGLADFGVNPATGVGYRYTTTEFWATTDIDGLTTRNNSLSDPRDLSIQLNANFEVDNGSSAYTYWVQDVAFLNSSSRAIAFIDNVWNMSASGASVYNTTITGNGSLAYSGPIEFYYAQAAYTLAGNDVILTYPSAIELAMTVSPTGGLPGVAFSYNDGAGWVTYDNIGLSFARGYSVAGLVVDGTGYNAAGLFDDAELTLGGPGGGSATTDVASKMTMSLVFYNGHNFQAVPNAYDFGSDTAEAISNVDPSGAYWRSNGTLYATEPNGAGSLGSAYNRSFAAILNISSPLAAGSVTINGTSYGTFVGGDMNLTLAPGTYSVALYATNGSLAGAQRVGIADGAYVALRFGAPASYRVSFRADGLPTGTSWSVTFNGLVGTTTNATLDFTAVNGSYGYSVSPVAGYVTVPWNGTITVAGANVNDSVHWSAFTYVLTFAISGLPSGTAWSVRVNSVAYPSTNASLGLALRNGSYAYFVPGVPGYLPTPNNGVANISGANTTVEVVFSSASYAVTLTEAGLPGGWIWSATVNGVTHSSGTNELVFGIVNGTDYRYAITPVAGYTVANRTGGFNVSGEPVALTFVFVPVLYAVEFSESGLPLGTIWSVTVGAGAMEGAASSFTFLLANGTYLFSVATAAPYIPGIGASSVSVAGQGGSLAIPFSPVNGMLEGSVTPVSASVSLNGTLLTTPAGVLNLTLLPGSYALEVSDAGYVTVTETVQVRAGAVTPVAVTLQPAPTSVTTHRSSASGPGGLSPLDWLAVLGVALVVVAIAASAYLVRRRRRLRRY